MSNLPTDGRVTDQRLQELIGGYDDQQSDGSWNRDLLAALRELQRVRKGKDWSWPEQPSEPNALPVPCWCPYCDQPHTPRIQLADPSSPTKPCSCPDTSESACGVVRGLKLGKLWHCRRAATKVEPS